MRGKEDEVVRPSPEEKRQEGETGQEKHPVVPRMLRDAHRPCGWDRPVEALRCRQEPAHRAQRPPGITAIPAKPP